MGIFRRGLVEKCNIPLWGGISLSGVNCLKDFPPAVWYIFHKQPGMEVYTKFSIFLSVNNAISQKSLLFIKFDTLYYIWYIYNTMSFPIKPSVWWGWWDFSLKQGWQCYAFCSPLIYNLCLHVSRSTDGLIVRCVKLLAVLLQAKKVHVLYIGVKRQLKIVTQQQRKSLAEP